MTLKEKIKLAFSFYKKSRKKVLYSIIMFICCLAVLSTLIFSSNVFRLINISINSWMFTTLSISPKENSNTITEEEKNQILNTSHVNDMYYGLYQATTGYITLDEVKDSINFIRASKNNLPKIKYGKSYSDKDEKVMVCPEYVHFGSYENLDKTNVINMKEYLNQEIEIEYYDYEPLNKGNTVLTGDESQKFKESFKIIGLYKNGDTITDLSSCFINGNDIERIVDNKYSRINAEKDKLNIDNTVEYSSWVVVDNRKNVNEVSKKLKNMGFLDVEVMSEFDTGTYGKIFLIIVLTLSISLFTTILVSYLFLKKKIIKEKKNISIMLTEGFTKKDIGIIYALEIFITNFIIFIIPVIISSIGYLIITNNISLLIMLDLVFNIKIGIINYLLAFILIVILPSLTTYLKIKHLNNN